MRPDGVAEACLVVPALQAVGRGLLDVGPTNGKLARVLELAVDDRLLLDTGPDHPVAPRPERVDEGREAFGRDDRSLGVQWNLLCQTVPDPGGAYIGADPDHVCG